MITNILLTDMKHYFLLFILLLVIITIEGCTEELHPETNGTNSPVLNEGELTKAVLDLSVNTFAVEAQAETRLAKRFCSGKVLALGTAEFAFARTFPLDKCSGKRDGAFR